MKIRKHLAGMVAALLVTAGGGQAARRRAAADRLCRSGSASGRCSSPQEKGLFAKEGVEVELINMAKTMTALFAGCLPGRSTSSGATVDGMLPTFRPGEDPMRA